MYKVLQEKMLVNRAKAMGMKILTEQGFKLMGRRR